MRLITLLILSIFSLCANSGSLFTFDSHEVLLKSLTHIQNKYPDLAKKELKPRPYPLSPSINKENDLVVSATFSYQASNEFGLLFVCAKINENGELVAIQRDIKARKGFLNSPVPSSPGCWGKP